MTKDEEIQLKLNIADMYECDPGGLDGFACGAAAAFGLMGMAEAIRQRYVCENCEGTGWEPDAVYCWTCRGAGTKT